MRDYHYKKIGLAPPADKKRRRGMRLLCLLCGSVASLGIGTCLNSEVLEHNKLVEVVLNKQVQDSDWFWGGADG